MQRIRVQFNRGEEIKFISHLDIMRLWERALRRAGVPIAYSQGFSPHPQISLAVPLSVGMTSDAELMDVVCSRPVTPQWFEGAVNLQLPTGIRVLRVQQVAPVLPSLQSQVRFAEYDVTINIDASRGSIESSIDHLLSLTTLPWQHQRDTGTKNYDLRPLISELKLIGWHPGSSIIAMRLRSDQTGSGRPEQVIAALGYDTPVSIHRTKLILESKSEAVKES